MASIEKPKISSKSPRMDQITVKSPEVTQKRASMAPKTDDDFESNIELHETEETNC